MTGGRIIAALAAQRERCGLVAATWTAPLALAPITTRTAASSAAVGSPRTTCRNGGATGESADTTIS